jgi:hypothetical protein
MRLFNNEMKSISNDKLEAEANSFEQSDVS